MRELNKIAEDLFNLIRTRFENVNLGDNNAKSTTDPEKARFINFDYVNKFGKKFGNITISIVDEMGLKVYFTKDITNELNAPDRDEWYAFLRNLRQFAKRNLLNFDTRDVTKNNLQVRDLEVVSKTNGTYTADEVAVRESKYNKYMSEFESWANQVHEGVWKMPMDEIDADQLTELLKYPIEAGSDGINAIGVIKDLIGSDSLFEKFKDQSATHGADSDVRPLVIQWLHNNGYEDLADKITQTNSIWATNAPSNLANVHTTTESVNTITKLAGINKLRRI